MKYFTWFILTITTFLMMSSAFAKFTMDIGIIHKKGGGKGTPLVSELYSSEKVYFEEPIIIKMKDEIVLNIQAFFSSEKDSYGPSKQITIKGTVSSEVLQESKEILLFVNLGEKTHHVYEFSDKRIVEVNFQPVL